MDFISQIIDEVVESVVEEKWLPIVDYEKYQVSDLGRVKNIKTGKFISCRSDKNGYLRVGLYDDMIQHTLGIHRLVLQSFYPNDEKLECDHINHIKYDNRLANLRWVTVSQQQLHRKKFGISSKYISVYWDKINKKWRSRCSIEGKRYNIGFFDDEHDAGRAYNEFIIKHNLQHFTILNDLTQLSR